MSEGDTPEEKGKEFLNDPAVDRITDELVEALKATIKAHGLKGLKSLSIVAIAGDAAGGVSGALTWGCDCTSCQIETVQTLAEAHGARATVHAIPVLGPADPPKVH
ncbi:hypothetical protein MASR1M32_10180 [Rhodobacter sp.]